MEQVSAEIQLERQAFFTRMASSFARRDYEAITAGVRPEVVVTLGGSSWLAGTYSGYEEFSEYVLGARQVLESAGKPISYLHDGQEMIVEHSFVIGNAYAEMPLHVKVRFADDGRIASLLIEPRDQQVFDQALEVFVRREAG